MTHENKREYAEGSMTPDAAPYVPKRFAKPDEVPPQRFLMPSAGFVDDSQADEHKASLSQDASAKTASPSERQPYVSRAAGVDTALPVGAPQQKTGGVSADLQAQMAAEQQAALCSLQTLHGQDEVCNPLYTRSEATTRFPRVDGGAQPYAASAQDTSYLPRYHQDSAFFDASAPANYMPDDRPVLRTIKPEPEQQLSKVKGCFSTLVMVACVLALAFLVRTYIVTPYEIPTGSMISTIDVGDRVFAERISSYLHSMPARGDIITFPSPEDPNIMLIKRCIAIEGDTINITSDGKLIINDVVQDEPYVNGQSTYAPSPLNGTYPTYPYTVGAGQVWVMGDNRGNSLDSRYFGTIDASKITGHAFACYWPFDRAKLLTPVDEIVHVSDPNTLK